jgi:hypothetical protein
MRPVLIPHGTALWNFIRRLAPVRDLVNALPSRNRPDAPARPVPQAALSLSSPGM